nr:protein arginine N-methyltransferase 7-like isoform X1 [Megalopta genalis]XP_033328865.1 protein arginine N-methyltransferase 7-like isoform X2 [Megalopta genalis]
MALENTDMRPFTSFDNWIDEDTFDYYQEIARSAFADMLHDHERNQKYYVALKIAIEKKHEMGEEANVLDIGTGTGLFSMMSAACGADTVTACEVFSPMAECAMKIIEKNGFKDKIRLIPKRSTKITVGRDGDMPKKANILIAEVFDTELIGEGALSTFKHAYENLLEEKSIVVPHSATIWVQVVESSAVHAWNKVQPIKYKNECLIDTPHSAKSCFGLEYVHDLQLTQFPYDAFTPLMPPQPVFRFDFTGKTPLSYVETVNLRVKPTLTGTAHAVFMWWDLNMDIDNQVSLSCAPVWEHPDAKKMLREGLSLSEIADIIPWRDHWVQAIYHLPVETSIVAGREISLIGCHDEYSLWFDLIYETITRMPVCSCGIHIAYSRTRMGQLNDQRRNEKYIRALEKRITPKTVCLCLSDGCLLGLAAIKLGAKKVFILETKVHSRQCMEKFITFNNLSEKVQIIESADDLPSEKEINLIFGEPYFITSMLPWDNLSYWYLTSKYSPRVRRIPIAATILAVAVEFKDLHKIRTPLGVCEGYDLSIFDALLQESSEKTDNPVEPQPLWEYPAKALSLPFVIHKFDLRQYDDGLRNIHISDSIPILESGSCNGVALWVDWHLNAQITVSSGPTRAIQPGARISWDPFTRQGVHIFRDVTNVTQQSSLDWSFDYAPELFRTMKFDFHVLSEPLK